MALIYSVFVGNVDSCFGAQANLGVVEWAFSNFKIVILYRYLTLPPHRTGDVLHAITIPPENDDPEMQEILRKLMRGRSVQSCLSYFEDISVILGIAHAKWLLKEVTEPDVVKHLQDFIQALSTTESDSKSGIVLLSDALGQDPLTIPIQK
jgi:hypothetical protein